MSVATFPSDIASDILLRDGTSVRLRSVREDDAARVLALFSQLSERSLYYRFMMRPHIDIAVARRIVTIDYDRELVVVAERGQDLCGIAGS